MNNYLIGIVIGCVVIVVGYRLIPFKKVREQKAKINQLTNDRKKLEHENYELRSEIPRNRNSIINLENRVDALEHRQDQADQWFGSVIRHSREQFSPEAVEKFLDEQGLNEEE